MNRRSFFKGLLGAAMVATTGLYRMPLPTKPASREDLLDVISMIAPEETPFYSAIPESAGQHYDWVIMDDIVSEVCVTTRWNMEQWQKLYRGDGPVDDSRYKVIELHDRSSTIPG